MATIDLQFLLADRLPKFDVLVVRGSEEDDDDLFFIVRKSVNTLVVSFNFDSRSSMATNMVCGSATFIELETIVSVLKGIEDD